MKIDPKTVIIPKDRQRSDLGDVAELAASIKNTGLIQPIVVNKTADGFILVAGQRRLTAVLSLGHPQIEAVYFQDLSERETQIIELEENIKRKDLTWQERAKAFLRVHRLFGETYAQTAFQLGYSSDSHVQLCCEVATEIEAGNEIVATAPNLSAAKGMIRRQRERSVEAARDFLGVRPSAGLTVSNLFAPPAPVGPLIKDTKSSIINADFLQFAPAYTGTRFNLIHCDFPYGIGIDTSDQGAAETYGSYKDDEAAYFTLLAALLANSERLIAESAHLICWLHMRNFEATKIILGEAGWTVQQLPLIWHKTDGRGIVSDPQRAPRHIYETALFASQGDRKIVRVVADCVGVPVGQKQHQSQKPQPVLDHFFRMLVDGTTRMLDPTCGSGTSIAAAVAAGAEYATGVEVNGEYCNIARANAARVSADAVLGLVSEAAGGKVNPPLGLADLLPGGGAGGE